MKKRDISDYLKMQKLSRSFHIGNMTKAVREKLKSEGHSLLAAKLSVMTDGELHKVLSAYKGQNPSDVLEKALRSKINKKKYLQDKKLRNKLVDNWITTHYGKNQAELYKIGKHSFDSSAISDLSNKELFEQTISKRIADEEQNKAMANEKKESRAREKKEREEAKIAEKNRKEEARNRKKAEAREKERQKEEARRKEKEAARQALLEKIKEKERKKEETKRNKILASNTKALLVFGRSLYKIGSSVFSGKGGLFGAIKASIDRNQNETIDRVAAVSQHAIPENLVAAIDSVRGRYNLGKTESYSVLSKLASELYELRNNGKKDWIENVTRSSGGELRLNANENVTEAYSKIRNALKNLYVRDREKFNNLRNALGWSTNFAEMSIDSDIIGISKSDKVRDFLDTTGQSSVYTKMAEVQEALTNNVDKLSRAMARGDLFYGKDGHGFFDSAIFYVGKGIFDSFKEYDTFGTGEAVFDWFKKDLPNVDSKEKKHGTPFSVRFNEDVNSAPGKYYKRLFDNYIRNGKLPDVPEKVPKPFYRHYQMGEKNVGYDEEEVRNWYLRKYLDEYNEKQRMKYLCTVPESAHESNTTNSSTTTYGPFNIYAPTGESNSIVDSLDMYMKSLTPNVK